MNSFTKHRITVFGINGCHDAIKSSIIDVNQVIIERNSPAENNDKVNAVLGTISQNLIEKVDSESFKRYVCLLYTSPSPRDLSTSRMPSSA